MARAEPQVARASGPPDETAESGLRALLRGHPAAGVLTIGTFDGVHAGHRALVARAAAEATARKTQLAAITFSPRPDTVISPETALPDICRLDERVARLRAAGADDVVVVPFTRQLMQLSAQEFMTCLVEELHAEALCVGEDFALGRQREGTIPALRHLGIEVIAVPVVKIGGRTAKISSSAIRRAIAAGVPAAPSRFGQPALPLSPRRLAVGSADSPAASQSGWPAQAP